MKMGSFRIKIALLLILVIVPIIVRSQGFHQKLFKVNDSSTYEELDKYLEDKGFQKVYLEQLVNNDTTTYYDKTLDGRTIIDYSPKSKIVSSYLYKWDYHSYLDDEFSKNVSSDSLIGSIGYYLNVQDSLRKEYGSPTSIIICERYHSEERQLINDKNIIDTLSIIGLVTSHEIKEFILCWDSPEKMVSLACHNNIYSEEMTIEYRYVNKKNFKIRQEEIESVVRINQLIRIAKWIIIVFAFLFVFGAFITFFITNSKMNQVEKEKSKEMEERIIFQKKKEEDERLRKIDEYKACYGLCTKAISNPNDSKRDCIRVYEESFVILINDVKYRFDEIIGYNLIDNSRVIKGELSSSTSTSNASAIGRAVVGAALAGVAGAVIGGATAKQKTEFKQGEDKTIHDYTVNINVNRLSEPLVKIHIGNNEDLANEISALINAIVVRNK